MALHVFITLHGTMLIHVESVERSQCGDEPRQLSLDEIEVEPTRQNLSSALGITVRRLDAYIFLLNKLVPNEFKYVPGHEIFSSRQVDALSATRVLFQQKWTQPQIEDCIIQRGLPTLKTLPVVVVEDLPTRENIARSLGISVRRLNGYIAFLKRLVPNEFKYQESQRVFTPTQVDALAALRYLYRKRQQSREIEPLIVKRGLPSCKNLKVWLAA